MMKIYSSSLSSERYSLQSFRNELASRSEDEVRATLFMAAFEDEPESVLNVIKDVIREKERERAVKELDNATLSVAV